MVHSSRASWLGMDNPILTGNYKLNKLSFEIIYKMPGTGHSHRFRGSISNRNSRPAFTRLGPWNARKVGSNGQVPVSTGGDTIKFRQGIGMQGGASRPGVQIVLTLISRLVRD